MFLIFSFRSIHTLLISCCLLSIIWAMNANKVQAQNPIGIVTPDGLFDTVSDNYGHHYNLSSIAINDTIRAASNGGNVLQPLVISTCNSGYFQLYLEQGCGMEGNTPVEQARLATVCRVLWDLSQFINSPLSTSGNTQKVNILVRNLSNIVTNPSNYLGVASGFYIAPSSSNISGIIDNTVSLTIRSGVDAYTNLGGSLSTATSSSNGVTFFHGHMAFNFSSTWNYNLGSMPNSTENDFYTVVLHEMLHALGFASLIDVSGGSLLGPTYQYYSRYDENLKRNNQTLITNTGNCSLYGYGWNTNLPLPSTLSPNPSNNIIDHTDCNTAVAYYGGLPLPQAVYTQNVYNIGSSLSHFEDECLVPSANNLYFVMSNAFNQGTAKRYPKAEERQVLCDIGYSVNNSYGNSSVVLNSYNSYGGIACAGNSIVGINDGINGNSYVYVTSPNVAVGLSGASVPNGILSNDLIQGQKGFECLEDITQSNYGQGTFNATSGTSLTNLTYTPPIGCYGVRLLRYVPLNTTTGQRGNITYIYVFVTGNSNCTSTPCNYVNNSDFENANGCYALNVNFGTVDCFTSCVGTPDLFSRTCSINPSYMIPTPYSNPPSESWSGGAPNNHFIGLGITLYNGNVSNSEGVSTMLNTSLQPGATYTISFWAKSANSNVFGYSSCPIHFAISDSPLAPWSLTLPPPSALTPLASFPIPVPPNNDQWHYLTQNFTYSANANPANYLYIHNYSATLPTGDHYIYIDDVKITLASNTSQFTPPSPITNICQGAQPIDLSNYVSIPGGTFSGPGVTGNIFDPNAAALQLNVVLGNTTANISYTYNGSCGQQTTYGQIEMQNVTQVKCCINPIPPTAILCKDCNISNYATNGVLNTSAMVIFDGICTVGQNLNFVNCPNLIFGPNATLKLGNGVSLKFTQSTLKAACPNVMWSGVLADNANNLITIESSTFYDMKDGVQLYNGAILNCGDAQFYNNYIGIHFRNTPNNYTGFVHSALFKTINAGLHYPYQGQKGKYGIWIENCNKVFIGELNTTAFVNTFDNLMTGIYITTATYGGQPYPASQFGIYNNQFNNITGGAFGLYNASNFNTVSFYDDADGTAVFAKNTSPIPTGNLWLYCMNDIGNNTSSFSNCTKAITTSGMGAKCNYLNINNCIWGASFSRGEQNNFYVKNNNLTNVSSGIRFAGNTKYTEVSGNAISTVNNLYQTFNNLVLLPVGVSATCISATSNFFKISDNAINIPAAAGAGCILSNFGAGLSLNNNTITLSTNSPNAAMSFSPLAGIALTNCKGGSLLGNHVDGTDAVIATNRTNVAGIYLSRSPNLLLECNHITKTRYGFLAIGDCGTKYDQVKGNTFKNHVYGMLYRHLGAEGSLGSMGNATNDNNNSFSFTTTPYAGGYKVYRLSGCQTPSGDVIYTNSGTLMPFESGSNSNNCWYNVINNANIATQHICPTYLARLSNEDLNMITNLDLAEQIAQDSVLYAEYQEGTAWLSAQQLYYQLYHDAEARGESNILDSFYLALQVEPLEDIREMDELLQKISDSTYADDAILYADWLAALANASTTIGGTALQETNEALINTLYADYLSNGQDSLDDDEIAAIAQMALQCPFVGGAAVYKARMLNALYQPDILYDDLDICNNQGVYKGGKGLFDEENSLLTNQGIETLHNFKLYPNPTNGAFTIEYVKPGTLQVTDILGRRVATYNLPDNKASFSLPVEKMSSGVYVYRYMINGKQEAVGKIIFMK